MSINSKTPAMILQEYTVKQKIAAPEYNLIVSKCGTHENEFHYKVCVAGISAIGIGRSKQVAKHGAASAALEKIGIHAIGGAPPNFQPSLHRNEPDNPYEGSVNSIGCLTECCAENKIPPPIFHEVSDVGPPHCRQFTYECEIDSIKTQATAKTKKQAKQLAAKLMLEKIKEMIPDLVSNMDLDNTLMEKDDDALNEYLRMHSFKVVMNKSAKILDFPNCFGILIKRLNLTTSDLLLLLGEQTEECLKKVLEKFELQHEFIQLQESPNVIVALDINLDTPFTVLGMGTTEDMARENTLKRTFNMLKSYISVAICDS